MPPSHSINIHLEHHRPPPRHRQFGGSLRIAIAVSLGMMIVEVWASVVTGSLALLSDAGHMLTDLSGLLLAYLALRMASRPATKNASFGFRRYEVLAAGANGVLLVGIAAFIVLRAIDRLQRPLESLDTGLVLAIAVLGLLANIVAAWLLRRDASHNINAEGAWWNVVGDAVASLGVIVATLAVRWTGDIHWDTYVSFLVAGIILAGAVGLLRRTSAILLETVPPGVDLDEIKRGVETLPGVVNVHDLHCWTHTPGEDSLTMHVSIDRDRIPVFHHVIRSIEDLLREKWELVHCTIQVEPEGEDPVSDHFDPVRGEAAEAQE